MSTATKNWKPDSSLFAVVHGQLVGTRRVREAQERYRIILNRIVLSTELSVRAACAELQTQPLPEGFQQHQLPFVLTSESLQFLTTCEPGAFFPEHSHADNVGLRVVISGSLVLNGNPLGPGDWAYVPAGVEYSLQIGPTGCVVYHVYSPDPG